MNNDDKKTINEGYQPLIKGYQPVNNMPTGEPTPQGGYQPTSSGDNPTNQPPPPSDE